MVRSKASIVTLIAVLGGAWAICPANTYYVSTSGSDSAAGSSTAPFRTIQFAANTAQPGDTVIITGGTYRETVTPPTSGTAGNPITFAARSSDTVVVDGCDLVTGWTPNGNAFVAPIAGSLGQDKNQVFFDGQPLHQASYPTFGSDPVRPNLAAAAAGTNATTIVDPNLTQPAGYWVGARIWLLGGNQFWEPFVATTGTVIASAPGTLSLQLDPGSSTTSDFAACAGTRYNLIGGGLSQPGQPGEWTIGGTDSQLNLLPPLVAGTPIGHTVELKKRALGFNLQGKSYINLSGLTFFAASANLASANYCSITNCMFSYVSHFNSMTAKGGWDPRVDTGVILSGTGNTLSNSVVQYSAGNGVVVQGTNNTVSNCVIRGADYAAGDAAGIHVEGVGHSILNNTIFESGRSGILHSNLSGGTISGNDISLFGMLTKDCGGTYAYQTNGSGTIISYNWVHDTNDSVIPGRRSMNGIYLDSGCANHVVHHNMVWNVEGGVCLNTPSPNNLLANNNFGNKGQGCSVGGTLTNVASTFVNNILSTAIPTSTGITWTANVSNMDPAYTDPLVENFTLKTTSPAYGTGVVVPNITAVNPPDVGAYQTGSTQWIPGSTQAPLAPCGLSASPSGSNVFVSWIASKGAKSYNVYARTATQGAFTLLANVSTPSATVTVPSGVGNLEFIVSGLSSAAEGPHSASVFAEPLGTAGVYPSSGGSLTGALSLSTDTAATNGLYVGRFTPGSFIVFGGVDGGLGGQKTFTVRYANGTSLRTMNISVNGGAPIAMTFPWTHGFAGKGNAAVFGKSAIKLTLNPGPTNTIRIISPTVGQTIDLDSIQIS